MKACALCMSVPMCICVCQLREQMGVSKEQCVLLEHELGSCTTKLASIEEQLRAERTVSRQVLTSQDGL